MSKKAIIIGAGPAGLTAAYELLTRTDYKPILIDKESIVGGLARTTEFNGNKIDIGPHRFFSKSDRVMDWWMKMMPLQTVDHNNVEITYRNKKRTINTENQETVDPEKQDRALLLVERQTRIYFLKKFFIYPIQLTMDTLKKMGFVRTMKVGFSYLRYLIFPIKPEKNLEDFYINRFGRELYNTFFKDYTTKVWGITPDKISAEWGAQRVKGLSIIAVIKHFVTGAGKGKKTETSLIEQFLYPKLGAGHMWETVAEEIKKRGGECIMNSSVVKLKKEGGKITGVTVKKDSGELLELDGDIFFSTMPIKHLVNAIDGEKPSDEMLEIANGLIYRDMINVALLLHKLKAKDESGAERLRDNWLYIQERGSQTGRVQIANNMSRYLLKDPEKVWIGAEYFCNTTDPIWKMTDEEIKEYSIKDLDNIELIDRADVIEAHVMRIEKTYPAYFGSYDRLPELVKYLSDIENLFLVGRNGMHKYNNQDHSMMTAMVAVDNIVEGKTGKENIWEVNTEEEYHEEKKNA
jgi:protoporphyrinogen oxidase